MRGAPNRLPNTAQERVRTIDLKEQIELDLRLALDELQSADDQVKVAQEGFALARNELDTGRTALPRPA